MNELSCKQLIGAPFPDDDGLEHHIWSFLEATSQTNQQLSLDWGCLPLQHIWLASVSLVLLSTCQALDNVCPGEVQVVFVLCSDIAHNHYSLSQHCDSKMHFGMTVSVTTSFVMHFNMRVKWWGTCATGVQKKISEDLIGQLGQIVGKARCLASGQHICTAEPKNDCVICWLAILHEGLVQCRPYRLP